MGERCWLAGFSSAPCSGRLIRAHLLPRGLLRQEYPEGAVMFDGRWQSWRAVKRLIDPCGPWRVTALDTLIDDPRTWVPACGGQTGLEGHHGMLDTLKVRLRRADLPRALEDFAAEMSLGWWIDRKYGVRA